MYGNYSFQLYGEGGEGLGKGCKGEGMQGGRGEVMYVTDGYVTVLRSFFRVPPINTSRLNDKC